MLLAATVLLCCANDDIVIDDDELSCINNCDAIYGDACLRECEFVLIETPEDLVECRKKCSLERADCIADCKPWWRGLW